MSQESCSKHWLYVKTLERFDKDLKKRILLEIILLTV